MSEPETPDVDWTLCTFAGNRLRQHQAYLALPFRAKLAATEEMGAVAPTPRPGASGPYAVGAAVAVRRTLRQRYPANTPSIPLAPALSGTTATRSALE